MGRYKYIARASIKGGLFATTTEFLQDDIKKTYSIVYGSEIPKVAMVAYDILSLLNATLILKW